MGKNAVERHPALLVRVETVVKKVAQKASVLRNPLAIDALCGSDGIRLVFGIGSEIAHRREAQARHDGVFDHVHVFVDLSRMEAAIQMDVPVAGRELSVDGVRKLPLGARNDRPLTVARVTNRQHVARVVRCRDGILDSADAAGDQVSQRNLGHLFRGHKIAAQQAGNRLSFFFRDRRVEVSGRRYLARPIASRGSRR